MGVGGMDKIFPGGALGSVCFYHSKPFSQVFHGNTDIMLE